MSTNATDTQVDGMSLKDKIAISASIAALLISIINFLMKIFLVNMFLKRLALLLMKAI